jgi:hypothetical protein
MRPKSYGDHNYVLHFTIGGPRECVLDGEQYIVVLNPAIIYSKDDPRIVKAVPVPISSLETTYTSGGTET